MYGMMNPLLNKPAGILCRHCLAQVVWVAAPDHEGPAWGQAEPTSRSAGYVCWLRQLAKCLFKFAHSSEQVDLTWTSTKMIHQVGFSWSDRSCCEIRFCGERWWANDGGTNLRPDGGPRRTTREPTRRWYGCTYNWDDKW